MTCYLNPDIPVAMPLPKLIRRFLLTPRRRETLAYLRAVPIRRLVLLLLAAFMIFTAIGLIIAASSDKPKHLAIGFLTAIFMGLTSSGYFLSSARRPRTILLVFFLQIVGTKVLIRLSSWIVAGQQPVSFEHAAHVYLPCAMVLIALSYTVFLLFIQTEGRFAFRAQTELALAHSMQETLVPVVEMVVGGCSVYGISVPSERVGGDLVDGVCLADGTGFAYLADIAGHGLQASILMGRVKTAFRSALYDLSDPGKLFDKLNAVLPGVKEANMYATSAALHLRPQSGGSCSVEFALAGHPSLLHIDSVGNVQALLVESQLPLGLLPFEGFPTHCVEALRGDMIVAATDGILEVCDATGEELGSQGLEALLKEHHTLPLPRLAQVVLAAAKAHGPQDDDQTLLLIRVL